MAYACRNFVTDFGFLRVKQNETVVKDLCVASATTYKKFRLKSSYKMSDHGSSVNGINWADVHKEYRYLHAVVKQAATGFAHLYAYGVSKCQFLSSLTGRSILHLVGLQVPPSDSYIHCRWCTLSFHKFPNFACASRRRTPSTIGWCTIYKKIILSNGLKTRQVILPI
jgi:hypothetical protein